MTSNLKKLAMVDTLVEIAWYAVTATIFTATWISYAAGLETSYFRHWDALNVPPETVVPMGAALKTRVGGLIVGPIVVTIVTFVGRLLSALAPEPAK